MNTNDLIKFALTRTCPAGLPHTGDNPEEDHGHTDCWVVHELIGKIRELHNENHKLVATLMGPYVTVNESKVEEVDDLLATYIGKIEIEKLEAQLPPPKCESFSFPVAQWAGMF